MLVYILQVLALSLHDSLKSQFRVQKFGHFSPCYFNDPPLYNGSDQIFSWSSSVINFPEIIDSAIFHSSAFGHLLSFRVLKLFKLLGYREGLSLVITSFLLLMTGSVTCFRPCLFIWACRCFLFGSYFWHFFFLQGKILNESDDFSNLPTKRYLSCTCLEPSTLWFMTFLEKKKLWFVQFFT